jgi:hypothetical protein
MERLWGETCGRYEGIGIQMRHIRIITMAGVAALALAGCGASVSGKAVEDPKVPSFTPPSSVKAPPATTTTTTEAPPPDDGSGLTPTGTTLNVGQTATVNYETKSLSKESTKLAVTAKSVKKGDITDLKDFNLDAQTKVSEPYYVTLSFKNVGDKEMEPSGIFGLVEAENAAGDKLGRLSLLGEFKTCTGLPPDKLAVGASFTECDVYVGPPGPGQGIAKVVFGFYLDDKQTEITWTAS